jgi:hypothetical protein
VKVDCASAVFKNLGIEWYDQLVGDFEVGEHVEGVVVVFEWAAEFEDLFGGFQVAEGGGAESAAAFLDGVNDDFLGHRDCYGEVDGGMQPGVHGWICIAVVCGECDFMSALAGSLALDDIDCAVVSLTLDHLS